MHTALFSLFNFSFALLGVKYLLLNQAFDSLKILRLVLIERMYCHSNLDSSYNLPPWNQLHGLTDSTLEKG